KRRPVQGDRHRTGQHVRAMFARFEHETILEPPGELEGVTLVRTGNAQPGQVFGMRRGSALARAMGHPRPGGLELFDLAYLVLLQDRGELRLGHCVTSAALATGLPLSCGRPDSAEPGSAARMRPNTTASTSASQDASMMFSDTPIVDQLPSASAVSKSTRVIAPVPLAVSRTRTR